MTDLNNKIEELRPWRYNHYHNNKLIIKSNPYGQNNASNTHEKYGSVILKHILQVISMQNSNFREFRVLDLGCLEGHYSDILCSFKFKEVVSIDLSEPHIARAKFLLQELKQYSNSTIIQGNVLDQTFMSSLGKFDLIFFHGLLYHLTSPVMMFEIIEKLINKEDSFYLLLGHQFHMNYGNMLQSLPVAEIKSRHLKPDDKLASKFDMVSMRLNVAALYLILQSYGYEGMIAYDAPSTKRKYKRRDIQIVLSKTKNISFLEKLNDKSPFPESKFYFWKGHSITNLKIINSPLRFFYRVLNRISTEIGK